MKKTHFTTKEVKANPEIPKPFILEYYITEAEVTSENICLVLYGIEILKKQNCDGLWLCESRGFHDITPSLHEAKDLVNLFAENLVTPVTLEYVLDNSIGVLK